MSPNDEVPIDTDAEVIRLVREARRLPMKQRLRMLDALKPFTAFEREDGLRFVLGSHSEYRRAKRPRTSNEPMVRWIESFGPGDVLYDVGANTGTLALVAAQAHAGAVPVVAFEPAFDNFAALVRNILANGMGETITPLQVALFDETGIRPFHRSSLGAGTALHAVGKALDYARRPFAPVAVEQVAAFRLDDLVRVLGLPRPTRLKLDVDGFEDRVLAGAADLLDSSGCDVFMELVEAGPEDGHPAAVKDQLAARGYDVAQQVDHRPKGTYPRIMDVLFIRRRTA
jgi:FkbM family methyltransferase